MRITEYWLAGNHPRNLVHPLVAVGIHIDADRGVEMPKRVLWRETPINRDKVMGYLCNHGIHPWGYVLFSYVQAVDMERRTITGACGQALTSLHKKLIALSGEIVPGPEMNLLAIPYNHGPTAWSVAKLLRELHIERYAHYYPQLDLVQSQGHVTKPHMEALRQLKIVPPFYISSRVTKELIGE
jgi:hypothetical protein